MKYCPDCGTPHECTTEQRDADKTEVTLARIAADRDIRIAEIGARVERHVADVEAEHSSEHAEGVTEGMTTVLEAVNGGGDLDDPDGDAGDPVVVTADADGDEDGEDADDDVAPPVVVPDPEPKAASGWWSGYSASRR